MTGPISSFKAIREGDKSWPKKSSRLPSAAKGDRRSTTTANISAALATAGFKVMQVGCDPKSDSTNTLRDGTYIPTVLDSLREGKNLKASRPATSSSRASEAYAASG